MESPAQEDHQENGERRETPLSSPPTRESHPLQLQVPPDHLDRPDPQAYATRHSALEFKDRQESQEERL